MNKIDTFIDSSLAFLSTANIENRPSNCKDAVNKAYEALAFRKDWGLSNGAPQYINCHIYDQKFIYDLIVKTPDQTDFYVLDIGGGKNGKWGQTLMEFINSVKIDRLDFKLHIISTRGESENHLNSTIIKTQGQCSLYLLDNFKIENLASELNRVSLEIPALDFCQEKKLDLIVSQLCFVHLIDPVGTFIEAYQNLKSKTGLFLTDGFHFQLDNENSHNAKNMDALLRNLGAKFIKKKNPSRFDLYALKKVEDQVAHIHFGYTDTILKIEQQASKILYHKEIGDGDIELEKLNKGYFGDRDLYQELIVTKELYGGLLTVKEKFIKSILKSGDEISEIERFL